MDFSEDCGKRRKQVFMDGSTNLSTKENLNYAHLCIFFVEVGPLVLREIFDKVCPEENIYKALTDPKIKEELQTMRKKRVLSQSQWCTLYPVIKSSVSSRDFDTSLLLLLLEKNILSETDFSPKHDLTCILNLRDRVYSHATDASVDNETFSTYWKDMKDTFLRIGGASCQDAINDIKNDGMAADLMIHYQERFREWFKDDDCFTDKSHEDETVKKARKEKDKDGSINISRKKSVRKVPVVKRSAYRIANPPELSVTLPLMRDLPKTCSAWSKVELPIDILLLTVEDCELLSCFAYLKEPFKSYHRSIGPLYFGCMGNDQGKKMKIALMRCGKGCDVPGGSLSASKDAILLLKPKATFSVGAFSGLKGKVKLGDVVVSSMLITTKYELPPAKLMNDLTRSMADGWEAPLQNGACYNAKVHCDGVVLSISKADRDKIYQHREAHAVEMEGGGLFAASHDCKTEWLVVKGIKNFVDEEQSSNKKWKEFASMIAASVVAHNLNDSVIFQDWPHFNPAESASITVSTASDHKRRESNCKIS